LNFEFSFIKIGRLYHIAAIVTIGNLVGNYSKNFASRLAKLFAS